MNYLKILYFLDFAFNFGGASYGVLKMAQLSQKVGNNIKIIIPTDKQGYYNIVYDQKCEELNLDYDHAYISVATEMTQIDVLGAIDTISNVETCIQKFEPDLIHSTQVNIAVEIISRKYCIPHMMSVYQAEKETFNFDYLKVYPAYHLTDSQIYSMYWGEGLAIESRYIRFGYKRISYPKSNTISSNEKIRMVCVGAVCKRKNQLGAIKLVKSLRDEGYHVELECWGNLAEESYVKECYDYIKSNSLESAVFLKNFSMEAEKEIRKADVLISCSFSESFPMVLIEAFRNGTAAIATPIGGIPEVIKNGHNGYLTEGLDQKDFKKSFFQYFKDWESGRISTIINNAYQTFEDLFLEEKNFNNLMQYYHFVCEDYKRKTISKYKEISFEDFQQIWKPYLNICDKVEDSKRYDSEEIGFYRNKLWWIYHVKKKLLQQTITKRLYLWGAGFWGKRVFHLCRLFMPEICIEGFIDSYKQGTYCGLRIYEPDVLKEDDMVLISNMVDLDYIVSYLKQKNFIENINYFKIGG